MAKVNNNIFVRGLSGSLGDQFVIRKGRGGETIVSNMPSSSEGRQFNQDQLDHQETFRHAIRYAKTVKNDDLYIKKAAGTSMTPFNAAVADFFRKPTILEIDTSEWQGRAGNEIWVEAVDDTLVTKVHVTISDPNGAVLEEGNAQRADACGGRTRQPPRYSWSRSPMSLQPPMTSPAIPPSSAWQNESELKSSNTS